MILMLDNYDSFTFNLVHYFERAGAKVEVVRADRISPSDALASGATGFVISPGPGRPENAGISIELVGACLEKEVPLLGVCLGHQAIGSYFGASIGPAPRPEHGKTSSIANDGTGLFKDLPASFEVTRYHSLVVLPDGLPENLVVNARASDGTNQAMRHRELPIHGLQFHPESIASEFGQELIESFVRLCN